VSWLEKRSRDSKEERFERVVGIGPERELAERSRWSRWCRRPSEGEIDPVSDDPDKLRLSTTRSELRTFPHVIPTHLQKSGLDSDQSSRILFGSPTKAFFTSNRVESAAFPFAEMQQNVTVNVAKNRAKTHKEEGLKSTIFLCISLFLEPKTELNAALYELSRKVKITSSISPTVLILRYSLIKTEPDHRWELVKCSNYRRHECRWFNLCRYGKMGKIVGLTDYS